MMKPELRKRLFTLQQRVAITGGEALALLGFVTLIGIGSAAAHLQGQRSGVDTSGYAALDAAIEAGASLSAEEALAALSVTEAEQPSEREQLATPEAPSEAAQPAPRPARLAPVRLDPNTASSQALQRLPGIGPAIAARVIEHRELHGPFRRPADIMAVRGIGPKTFERLEPYLVVVATPPDDTLEAYLPPGSAGESSASSEAPSPAAGGR